MNRKYFFFLTFIMMYVFLSAGYSDDINTDAVDKTTPETEDTITRDDGEGAESKPQITDPFVRKIVKASGLLAQAQQYMMDEKSVKAGKTRREALGILTSEIYINRIIKSEKICTLVHKVDSVWGWHFFVLSPDENGRVIFWFDKSTGINIKHKKDTTGSAVFEQIEDLSDGEEIHAVIKIVTNSDGKCITLNEIFNNAVISCQVLSIKKIAAGGE